jgi:GT2 family glycosyltransferase
VNWIVCPVRNGLAFTRDAVRTFLAQDIGNIQVLLIDNNSNDGTGQWARSVKHLRYWWGPADSSVSQGWNRGLRFVFGMEPCALVVNNDVLLRPDTYRLLVEDGGGFVTGTGVDNPEQMEGDPVPSNKRPHPDFSCFLIRKTCYEKVGPFNEEYAGGYAEDSEYHVRMHRAGIRAESLCLPFLHYACGTIKSATPSEAKAIGERAEANRERFRKQFGCLPGSPEYAELFDDRWFGSEG